MVRGELFRVRRGSEAASRRRCGATASRALPQPARLNTRARSESMTTTGTKATLDIDGSALTLSQRRDDERARPMVRLSDEARRSMQASVDAVARAVTRGEVTYGINTGFGAFASKVIPAAQTRQPPPHMIRRPSRGS